MHSVKITYFDTSMKPIGSQVIRCGDMQENFSLNKYCSFFTISLTTEEIKDKELGF